MSRARSVRAPGVHTARATRSPAVLASSNSLLATLLLGLLSACGASNIDESLSSTSDDTGGVPQPAGGGSEPYAVGTELAVVELAQPASSSFVMRATVPIPTNLFPREDDLEPFSIKGPDGTIVPAQNELVSWYPDHTKGADVVEVIARIDVPKPLQGAERLVCSVVWDPHPVSRLEAADSVLELLRSEEAIVATSRDVFDHEYSADLLRSLRIAGSDFQTTRSGKYIHQVVLHEWLQPDVPVSGNEGTLPHLMGLHAFVALYDREEFFSFDLRVHNGGSGLDPDNALDDPLGELFFEDLKLQLPAGWKLMSAVSDPYLGPPSGTGSRVNYPIVSRLPGGAMHLMPAQAQFQRRLVVYRDDPVVEQRARATLREEGLAFVRRATNGDGDGLFSWWNPSTSRYFPQNQRLPDLGFLGEDNLRAKLSSDLSQVEKALREGTINPWPIVTEVMGWCHPWGPSIGYLHGGSEVFMLDGLRTASSASNDGYMLHQRTQRMYTCRQPDTLYNANGRETCVDDWLQTDANGVTYLPVWVFLTPVLFLGDAFGFGDAPTFQQQAVAAMGLEPTYAETLRNYQPIDIEHMVRYSRSLKTLAWLGNDALAKSDLRMQAELMRLSYNRWPQSPSGQAIVTGMYEDSAFVHAHPGEGFNVNRGEGWAIDTVVAAYALADLEWRGNVYPWFRNIINLFHEGQESCSGVVGSVPNWSWFDAQYRMRQSISSVILENALWSTMSTVFAGQDAEYRDRAREVLTKSAYAMIHPDYWNEEEHAPWFFVATGPFDTDQPGFCGPPPADAAQGWDDYQTWSSFAIGYRLTHDAQFLNRANEMAHWDLRGVLEKDGPGELENRAALLVLIQEQGGL